MAGPTAQPPAQPQHLDLSISAYLSSDKMSGSAANINTKDFNLPLSEKNGKCKCQCEIKKAKQDLFLYFDLSCDTELVVSGFNQILLRALFQPLIKLLETEISIS